MFRQMELSSCIISVRKRLGWVGVCLSQLRRNATKRFSQIYFSFLFFPNILQKNNRLLCLYSNKGDILFNFPFMFTPSHRPYVQHSTYTEDSLVRLKDMRYSIYIQFGLFSVHYNVAKYVLGRGGFRRTTTEQQPKQRP